MNNLFYFVYILYCPRPHRWHAGLSYGEVVWKNMQSFDESEEEERKLGNHHESSSHLANVMIIATVAVVLIMVVVVVWVVMMVVEVWVWCDGDSAVMPREVVVVVL